MLEKRITIDWQKQRTIVEGLTSPITGDYNTTKLVFDFKNDIEGTHIFELNDPSGKLLYSNEIINNEIILVGEADVTTTHNEKTYVKYQAEDESIFWYNEDDNELYTSEWVLDTTTQLDTLTKQTEDASLFTTEGIYVFEVSVYTTDGKLTSMYGNLKVLKEQVKTIDDEVVTQYLPVFDSLLNEITFRTEEANNLNITATRSATAETITITKKDGTTETTEIYDGLDAKINGVNTLTIEAGKNIELEQEGSTLTISAKGGGGGGGTSDYEDLDNLPKINNVELKGNKTTSDLGLPTKTSNLINDSGFITNSALTDYAKKNQNNNFSSDQTISGDLVVYGDITNTGSSYETHAEKIYTKNDYIITRDGAVSGLGSGDYSGFQAKLYDGTNDGRLVFDNTGTARVGDVGDEVPLLARDESSNITNGQVLVWDGTDLIAKGSSDYIKTNNVAKTGSTAPTTSTVADFVGQLYLDTTNNNSYQCTAITTVSNVTTYTWTQLIRETNYATTSKAGLIQIGEGLKYNASTGVLQYYGLGNSTSDRSVISGKSSVRQALTPGSLDYAVQLGVTTNVNTLTDTEKTNACNWLGTGKMVTITQTDYDALVSGGTVDANTYYFIIPDTE